MVGNVESTQSASFKLDLTGPTTPTAVTHMTDSTSTVTLSWGASTDALSGLRNYQILVNGAVATQTASTTCTVTGLTGGQTYSFIVRAVDNVGNMTASTAVTETVADPSEYLRMTIQTPDASQTVNFHNIDPVTPTTMSAATTITVSGFTALSYTLKAQGSDFTGLLGATMPISQLMYRVYGTATVPWTALTTAQQTLATGSGVHGRWKQNYFFDYRLTVPYTSPPDTYTAPVLYTLVEN
jgi:chitodextrinase